MRTIAVTGVAGHIGSRVAAGLAERELEARLLLRDPSMARGLPLAGELDVVTSAVADLTGTPARSLREHLRS